MSLGVKESTNRVTIGVSDSAAEASVREFLRDLRVPEEAVTFQLEGPLVLDSYTLRYAQPDSLIQGGWEISNGTQACTLGFPARRTTDGAEVFVTNSHCTSAPFQSDQGSIWQPFGGGGILIGQETFDPSNTCGINCRHSDAALIMPNGTYGVDFARIARTVDSASCEVKVAPRHSLWTVNSRRS
jgi:hypothetical protein